MQEKLPDLTPYLPWLGMAAVGLWKLWESIKKGKKADRDEREEEVHKSLMPVTRRAEEAEALLILREKRLAIIETEKMKAEAEVERLKQKLTERDDIEDRLQSNYLNLVGRMDELERWVDSRGNTDESSRRRG